MARKLSNLRFVAFQVVASSPDGKPIYSVVDIIEPLAQYRTNLLRNARKSAGPRGYVMVGRNDLNWEQFDATARRINGTY